MSRKKKYQPVGRYVEEFKIPMKEWVVKHNLTHNHITSITYDPDGNVLIPGSVVYEQGKATFGFSKPVCGTVIMDDSRAQMLWVEICKEEAKKNDIQAFS